jgi:hypothetical protein
LSYHPGLPKGADSFSLGRQGKFYLQLDALYPDIDRFVPISANCLTLKTIVGTILKFPDQNDPEHMTAKAQEVALDRLLVDRFKGGDTTAFDQLVTRYWDRIYAMTN